MYVPLLALLGAATAALANSNGQSQDNGNAIAIDSVRVPAGKYFQCLLRCNEDYAILGNEYHISVTTVTGKSCSVGEGDVREALNGACKVTRFSKSDEVSSDT